jgi:hypothetical protein
MAANLSILVFYGGDNRLDSGLGVRAHPDQRLECRSAHVHVRVPQSLDEHGCPGRSGADVGQRPRRFDPGLRVAVTQLEQEVFDVSRREALGDDQ